MADAADYQKLMWASGAMLVRESSFTLKSGRSSHAYANHRDLVGVPEHLELLVTLLVDTTRSAFTQPVAFCSVDSSVSPYLVAACSLRGRVPFYNYRAVSREAGVAEKLFRYDRVASSPHQPGLPAVLLDDVVTTTGTLTRTEQTLRSAGIDVLGAVCLLDRRLPHEADGSTIAIASVSTLEAMLEAGAQDPALDATAKRYIEVELTELAG